VPRAFERWAEAGKLSVSTRWERRRAATPFRTTRSGDLTFSISAFFDTRVGAKNEQESYKKIAASLSSAPQHFLFISDAVKEIEAAQSARCRLSFGEPRPGICSSRGQCEAIHSFDT